MLGGGGGNYEIDIKLLAKDLASGIIDGVGAKLGGLAKAGLAFGAIAAPIGLMVKGLYDCAKAAADAQVAEAALDAVLKSTGGSAGMTKDAVLGLADSLAQIIPADDEAILAGENMLLTFTNIGKEVFPDATKALLDMATAMNSGMTPGAEALKGQAIQLGKALNDPVKGMAALRRVGVAFTDAQQDMIKALVASGDIVGAQKFILKELQTEFGGAAEAAGKTLPGQLVILNSQFENFKEIIGGAIIPIVSQLLGGLLDLVKEAGPAVKAFADSLAGFFDNLGINLFEFAETAEWLPMPLRKFLGVLGETLGGAGSLGDMLKWLAKEAQPVGDFFSTLFENFSDSRGILYGIAGGFQFLAEELLGALGFDEFTGGGLSDLFESLRSSVQSIIDVLQGVWANAWANAEELFAVVWGNIRSAISSALPVIINLFKMLAPQIASAVGIIGGIVNDIVNFMAPLIGEISDFFVEKFGTIVAWVDENMPLIQQTIETVLAAVKATWDIVWPYLKQVIEIVWGAIQGTVNSVLPAILDTIKAVMLLINGDTSGALTLLQGTWTNALNGLIGSVLGFFNSILGLFGTSNAQISSSTTSTWTTITTAIQTALSTITGIVQPALNAITGWWSAHGSSVMVLVNTYWQYVQTVFSTAMNVISTVVSTAVSLLQTAWQLWGDNFLQIASNTWEFVKVAFTTASTVISGIIDLLAALIEGDWQGVSDALVSISNSLWTLVQAAFNTGIANLGQILSAAGEGLKKIWESIDWTLLGKGIIDGIRNGITAGLEVLRNAAREAAEAALQAAKKFLGIASPSKVFMRMGTSMMEGVSKGVLAEGASLPNDIQTILKNTMAGAEALGLGATDAAMAMGQISAGTRGYIQNGSSESRAPVVNMPAPAVGVRSAAGPAGAPGVVLNMYNYDPDASELARRGTWKALATIGAA